MAEIFGNGSFTAGTSGSDLIHAGGPHDILYGGAGNDTFMIDKSVMGQQHAGSTVIQIADFAGASPTNGLGEQDYLLLTGFSVSATVQLDWANGVDARGGQYLTYSVIDGGQHYDFIVYSTDGNVLTANTDYAFLH